MIMFDNVELASRPRLWKPCYILLDNSTTPHPLSPTLQLRATHPSTHPSTHLLLVLQPSQHLSEPHRGQPAQLTAALAVPAIKQGGEQPFKRAE